MKHLPNELLYLLKVYNYITQDIGLDHARSRADDIRAYIANADFLDAYPTVKEYLSEDKSIEDIITYIRRNERTYSLLGEWRDREIEALLSAKGIKGSLGEIGSFTITKEGNNAYFLLPDKPCADSKILLLDAGISEDIFIEKILWLEFFKTREEMCLEVFDDNCNTSKISFTDFEIQKAYSSASPLAAGCKNPFDAVLKMSALIYEKYEYDSKLLTENEKELLPVIKFFSDIRKEKLCDNYETMAKLFDEHGLCKGQKILTAISVCDSEKRKSALSKKLSRFLRSKKCIPLIETLKCSIISSQENI